MQIRKATIDDALAIKQIHQSAYKVSYRGYVPDEYLDSLCITDDILQRTKNYLKTTECYVIEQQNEIIGFAYIGYPQDGDFEINALYIEPKRQKLGAGSMLVNYLCEAKKNIGYQRCVVWTMKFGPSLGFYEKQKFYSTANEKTWKFDIPIIELVRDL